MHLLRKVFICIPFLLLMAGCTLSRQGAESKNNDSMETKFNKPFYFIQMADPQLGFKTKGTSWEYEEANFKQAIEHANRLKPDFVLICGDLINNPDVQPQIDRFLELMNSFSTDFPVYLVAGNHDIKPDFGPEEIRLYKKWFGEDYYAFSHKGCRFIVIDTTLIRDPDKCPEYVSEMKAWMVNELKTAREKGYAQTLMVGHHPWFLNETDEENEYFNMPKTLRLEYLDLFRQHGVEYIFAGHYHRNKVVKDDGLEMITSGPIGPSLGKDPSGIRIVKVHRDHIEHKYYGLEDVPETLSDVEF